MARSKLPNPANDLISDAGAVLFSIVMGEQFEYPFLISNLPLPVSRYELTAGVVEAENIEFQTEKPRAINGNTPVFTPLEIRLPTIIGVWEPGLAVGVNEIVYYGDRMYVRKSGSVISTEPPITSDEYEEVPRGRAYLRIPETLGTDWEVQPGVDYNTYGFIEVSVAERSGDFKKVWKPVRGMVEILYSPLHA